MLGRFVGERARTETSLRLWLFMALCGVLSALLMVALVVENASGDRYLSLNTTPVFLPNLNMASLNAIFRHSKQPDDDGNYDHDARPVMRLVETLPVGAFALNSTLAMTHEVLLNHTNHATTSIDISAMYWNLLGKQDRLVYSDKDMTRFGADRGVELFQALVAAAKRGVVLRIVTAGDSIGHSGDGSSLPDELQQLMAATPPGSVQIHQWSGTQWYGGGILHQKLWIFDRHHVYIGSANMDWKSLAQVMEMGVLLEGLAATSRVLDDVQRLFDVWWRWCALANPAATAVYFSDRFQAKLKVPAWSTHVEPHVRMNDPFLDAGLAAHGNLEHQLSVAFANDDDDKDKDTYTNSKSQLFVASAPLESTARSTRTFDEDALVYTIRSATTFLGLSVMDFTPYAMYGLETHANASIYWPALTDALLAAVYAKKGLRVQLLISQWQHSRRAMFESLQLLQKQAALCQSQLHCGAGSSLEIKIFRVPGWQNTTGTTTATATGTQPQPPLWPAFTRVNHAKYLVSDQRVNIGTSNMEWGYFYTTAGISVNTDHAATRTAMEHVFTRNWHSPYAVPLSEVLRTSK